MEAFSRQMQALRLPLLMAAVAALLFMLPDQAREIYRALAQTSAATDWTNPAMRQLILPELCLGTAGIVVLSLALWLSARRAASTFQLQREAGAKGSEAPDFTVRSWPLLWFPRLLVLPVPVFAAVGVLRSGVQPGFEAKVKDAIVGVFKLQFTLMGSPERFASRSATRLAAKTLSFSDHLLYFATLLLVVAAVVFLLVLVLDRPALARFLSRPKPSVTYAAIPVTLVMIFTIVATVLAYPVAVPQMVGSNFIMSLFLVVLLFILLQLQTWRQRTGVPLTSLLLFGAIMFSVLDWNDNHSIRSLQSGKPEFPLNEGFAKAFKRWMASRADVGRYAGKPYPIYIVAAQGGGIYAAAHVASYLGELQDLCPGFGHHLFAISGVSGGSVGGAIFAALTKDMNWADMPNEEKFGCVADINLRRPAPFMNATTSIFHQDLWSPLSASLLFPDFFQRFIFFPVPSWDRGRALELALEDAYDKGISEGRFLPPNVSSKRPLAKSFSTLWNPEGDSHTPALFLNATEVGSGRRRVLAPFSFHGIGRKLLPIWASDEGGKITRPELTPPLSTAAGLSARFPWITPAAHFYEKDESKPADHPKRKVRIVDGGYFENSGVVTALDLAKEIAATVREGDIKQRVEINLLVFTSAEFDVPGFLGLGEAMDPIRTMFNARAARAGIAVEEAREALKNFSTFAPEIKTRVVTLELNGYGYPLPLGWRLSPVTRHLISYHNGSERHCKVEQPSSCAALEVPADNASCAKKCIYDQLR